MVIMAFIYTFLLKKKKMFFLFSILFVAGDGLTVGISRQRNTQKMLYMNHYFLFTVVLESAGRNISYNLKYSHVSLIYNGILINKSN